MTAPGRNVSAQHIFHELRRLVMGETEQEQAPTEEPTTGTDDGEKQDGAEQEQAEEQATDRMNSPTE